MFFSLRIWILNIFILIGLLTSLNANENEGSASFNLSIEDPVRVKLVTEEQKIEPERPFWVAIQMTLDEGWHAYWKNPGDVGMPPKIEWTLPEGFTISEIQWPYPERFTDGEVIGFGYEKEFLLMAEITPPKNLDTQQPLELSAQVGWVACSSDTCLPGSADLHLSLPVTGQAAPPLEFIPRFEEGRRQLPSVNHQIEVSLKNSGESIAFVLPNNTVKTKRTVYFCPEADSYPVNFHQALEVKENEDGTLAYLLKTEQNPQNNETLKGILVFKDPNDVSKTEALAINTPLAVLEEAGMSEFEGGIALALLFAFLGGLILNLMPCVLPVISFKILSFVKLAGQDRSLTFKHGFAFSLGVLVSFWLLAGVLLILQGYGHVVGWGFQLQQPIFVALLAALILVFGLSLFGLFEFGAVFASWAGSQQQGGNKASGLSGSFFGGVLATAVATPCTGPFLGSAIGFAVTLPAFWALSIFTALGLGMASPYLIFSAFPALMKFLPKPGPWMITFKEMMGFLMLATALWLAWVFGAQTGTLALMLLLAAFLIMAVGCWIYGKWGSPIKPKRTRMIGTLIAAMLLMMGGGMLYQASTLTEPVNIAAKGSQAGIALNDWEPFSAARVKELQEKGIPVFIDFTAKWCLICQANHMVLSMDSVAKKMRELGVVKMKADWTKNDPDITQELRRFGRNGVPLYLLYTANREAKSPIILPQVLTPETVVSELNKIAQQQITHKN